MEQLQQLTGAKPSDPDVWRVLAESQSALGDRKAAIASYQRAWQEVQAARATSGSLEVLQGLAGELMAAGKEQQVRMCRVPWTHAGPSRCTEPMPNAGALHAA